MKENRWTRLLAYVTGMVNQELLLQNEYLAAENRILRAHLPTRWRLADPERSTLAEIGKRLGRQALAQVACVAKPDTILAWYRRLIAQKFDGFKHRRYPGRPRIEPKLETLIVQMASENSGWGYDRIVGALANLGYTVSDQTVGNVLKRHGTAPAPKRSQTTTWKEFIQSQLAVLAGIRLLHGRGLELAWTGNILRLVFHSSGEPPRQLGRDYAPPRPRMDATNGAQRDQRELGIPGSAAVRFA
jgi:putative transposase